MTRAKLARFYQNQAARFQAGATEAREKIALYRRSWLWRHSGLPEAWLQAWDNYSTYAEAYALTARMLQGMEE